MAMPMIYQAIYDTLGLTIEEVITLTGIHRPDAVERKRELVRLYLSVHEVWDLQNFERFAVAQIETGWYEQNEIKNCGGWKIAPVLPSKLTMAKNLLVAGVQAISTFFNTVSKEEQERRHNICTSSCEFYVQASGQCAKCGCFTTYKAKLEAWHCPIKKW